MFEAEKNYFLRLLGLDESATDAMIRDAYAKFLEENKDNEAKRSEAKVFMEHYIEALSMEDEQSWSSSSTKTNKASAEPEPEQSLALAVVPKKGTALAAVPKAEITLVKPAQKLLLKPKEKKRFPWWTLLGLAGGSLAWEALRNGNGSSPAAPTPEITPTPDLPTPTPSPTVAASPSPQPSPTMTSGVMPPSPAPSPSITPTPPGGGGGQPPIDPPAPTPTPPVEYCRDDIALDPRMIARLKIGGMANYDTNSVPDARFVDKVTSPGFLNWAEKEGLLKQLGLTPQQIKANPAALWDTIKSVDTEAGKQLGLSPDEVYKTLDGYYNYASKPKPDEAVEYLISQAKPQPNCPVPTQSDIAWKQPGQELYGSGALGRNPDVGVQTIRGDSWYLEHRTSVLASPSPMTTPTPSVEPSALPSPSATPLASPTPVASPTPQLQSYNGGGLHSRGTLMANSDVMSDSGGGFIPKPATMDWLHMAGDAAKIVGKGLGVAGLVMTTAEFVGNLTAHEKGEKLTAQRMRQNFAKNAIYNGATLARMALIGSSVAGLANPVTGLVGAAAYVTKQSSEMGLEKAIKANTSMKSSLAETLARLEERKASKASNEKGPMIVDRSTAALQTALWQSTRTNQFISEQLNAARNTMQKNIAGGAQYMAKGTQENFSKAAQACAQCSQGFQKATASLMVLFHRNGHMAHAVA